MKFTSLLRTLIVEASKYEVQLDLYTKPQKGKKGVINKPKMSKKIYDQLVMADPTTILNDVDLNTVQKKDFDKVKAGKYVDWLVQSFLKIPTETQPGEPGYERELKMLQDRFIEDLSKVTEDLKKFNRFKNKLPEEKRQIQKMSPSDLYNAVKDFDISLATTTKAERKTAPVHPGAKLIYDSPNLRAVEISDKGALGKEAACFYGGNQQETRWCTSAPGLSHFDYYIGKGPLYVIFDPSDPNVSPKTGLPIERYQLNFETDQYMDRHDHSINLIDKLNGEWAPLKQIFKPKFAKGLTVGGTALQIDNFRSGNVGKFIALYGLEELFKSLPETLTDFQISNNDRDSKIQLTIPEEISRFKDLEMILLDNVISSIPESICELKNLRFIALMNNPNLTKIPDCLLDMPNLVFINLRGSNNVEISPKMKEKAKELGNGMWDLQEM